MKRILLMAMIMACTTTSAFSEEGKATAKPCATAEDRACLFADLEKTIGAIEEDKWRDIAYRELAKTLAADGQMTVAQSIVAKITNPDTQALTIRGIGDAAAKRDMAPGEYDILFTALASMAASIDHAPSREIAHTYIAMSQASAKQTDSAFKTAAAMENQALRNKAFGEIGEILADRGETDKAIESLSKIDSPAYQNKSRRIIAKILADKNAFNDSLKIANQITNPVLKAEAIQYILYRQKPDATAPETEREDND